MCLFMNKTPIIALQDIIKKYSIGPIETTILQSLSLHVHPKEMVAIVGASGSGKSTLMNIIGLLDKPDSGLYELHGKNIQGLSHDECAILRNQHIGFVFQQFNLLPRFTALQNVALPLTYRNLSAHDIQSKALDALSQVGMKSYAKHHPTQLSGGQQQRVAIARAIIGEPEVILADEPTGALDSTTSKEIMRLFHHLNEAGRTMILVTHDKNIANQCERSITLADGKIIKEVYQ